MNYEIKQNTSREVNIIRKGMEALDISKTTATNLNLQA
jgi:hypothetical protein